MIVVALAIRVESYPNSKNLIKREFNILGGAGSWIGGKLEPAQNLVNNLPIIGNYTDKALVQLGGAVAFDKIVSNNLLGGVPVGLGTFLLHKANKGIAHVANGLYSGFWGLGGGK